MFFFFFSSRRRHTRSDRDWSSDVCSSDLRSLLEVSVLRRGSRTRCSPSLVRRGQRSAPTLGLEEGGSHWRCPGSKRTECPRGEARREAAQPAARTNPPEQNCLLR